MEGKLKDGAAPERPVESNDYSGTTRDNSGTKRKKFGWKSMLAVAVALLIVWQLYHVLTQGNGKTTASGKHSSSSTAMPKSGAKSTPAPMVTLGGRRISAGGGPVIVLNPGLVTSGGLVGVDGSGFAAHTSVVVYLKAAGSRMERVVAHGHTSEWGSLWTHFTMPVSQNGNGMTVVAQQTNGKTAQAPLMTAGGMGTVTIDGKSEGKPGDTVTVSASGFGPNEKVNAFWGRVNGTPAAILTADSSGSISEASIPVGVAPTGPTTLVLVGMKTHTTATAPYTMLGLYPSTTPHPYAARAGHPVTFTGTGFAPDEQILIYLNAASGTPALVTKANGGGGFSTGFVVPFGLRGAQTLTAVGAESRASVTSGFTVEAYNPSAEASTYGALPGTSVSFYADGFASNEVVLVYLTGVQGSTSQLVTAFRVDSKGAAANAGSYVVPSGVGPELHFNLVGQKSGGTAVAKLAVTAAPQGVTVPPQKPYVLPPSLGGKPVAGQPGSSGAPSSPPPSSPPASTPPPSGAPTPGQQTPGS
jgi:hypothetical protein